MRQAVRRISRLVALVLVCASLGNVAPPSPADLYGDLFVAVQERRIFDDNKTFADAVPRKAPAAIMADYRAAPPRDDAALRAFVLDRFEVPGVNDAGTGGLRAHIRKLWPHLVRQPAPVVPGESRIALPAQYVVPGGRFREIYYWDSYFTMLGLAADGEHALVESMLDDFTSLIERFGHIPNGTRTYYVSRSQPPFFALMLDISQNHDARVQARRLEALRSEYAFWMAGGDCALRKGACLRVVRMPDGSLLNRYWDERDTPRDESFAEDRASAKAAANRASSQVYRDLRAAAESGWDFSSRWLADGRTLATIRTTDVVPVDLNALLWAMERRIARGCKTLGDAGCARDFVKRADRRRAAVDRFLWQAGEGCYGDWLIGEARPSPALSAATLYPLFVGMASAEQADGVAELTRAKLVAPGGLRTTLTRSGQQWDAPNGWAPLQWIAVGGLDSSGHAQLARTIAARWIATVARTYAETGKMLEKYDVEERLPGGGGEYPLQDGFGWTNGVTGALLDRYPALDREAP
ncbi:alpha,alpha-trehalase TreF [Novosphingobium pentaromativorans]|uniref:Alpha,alpha-trehalase n=1 Tax=Novosphingobium pentaromativorans US6-1 TaxID=1088721 RepID=G6EHD5_9SPHN|nr:alpha,alpha-trehalase TreF [Novosphingobium pentaromativorans]AIT81907.1 trehalase [Novosphingobium pentaromativorans US6-1]EHJ59424.1 alpha,alpha-trehalase [Novosphingobium pentaromativorans US6-1]